MQDFRNSGFTKGTTVSVRTNEKIITRIANTKNRNSVNWTLYNDRHWKRNLKQHK